MSEVVSQVLTKELRVGAGGVEGSGGVGWARIIPQNGGRP